MQSFVSRFQALVFFVLTGFDRLRFCGESRLLNHAGGVSSFLYQFRIPRKDFGAYCEKLTATLRVESKRQAAAEGVPVHFVSSPKVEKDVLAVYRTKEGEDDSAPKSWQQMRKGGRRPGPHLSRRRLPAQRLP